MLLKNWKYIWKKTKQNKTLHYADAYIYWVIYMTLIEVARLKGSCNISVVVELVSEQCIFIFLLFSLEIR